MNGQPDFADVILPLPLDGSFTFLVPGKLIDWAEVGKRVIVQFGRKKIYTGIIIKLHNTAPENYQVKEIIDILDSKPLVNNIQLELWHWIANYYLCSDGEVLRAALPSGLSLESETTVRLESNEIDISGLSQRETIVIANLKTHSVLNISKINELLGLKNSIPVVKGLIEKKAVCVEEKLVERFKERTETIVHISPEYNNESAINEILDKLSRAPNQHKLVMTFLHESSLFSDKETKPISRKQLLRLSGSTHSTLNALVKKGIFQLSAEKVSRLNFNASGISEFKQLTDIQQAAIESLKEGFRSNLVGLLHGVTSSGKTEIYIHLIDEYISMGKQVLYLLPEIALTTQIINRLHLVFGNKAGVYHSRFTNAEQVEIWFNILDAGAENSYKLILGTRSALFLPFSNLGLIIIDEEHENSFKQHSPAPRYNARDTAIVLAKMHGAQVVLGTATPSIESYFGAKLGRYHLVEMYTRYSGIKLPAIEVIDIKTARRKKQMKSIFSPQLIESISESLETGKQVILFQNRRGFAPYIECNTCNWVPRCNHCDVSLTYHKFTSYLNCHYCGHSIQVPQSCPACGNEKILTRGFGTEKVEDEIALFFPGARIKRMDLDSTRTKNSYHKIIADFEHGEIDILVGTQMISKGLDFDNVSLVGILNADSMMNFPDFRALERSYQMMSQVSGRAGRKNKRGKVIIQTSDPDHPIINDVVANDYLSMFRSQTAERKMFNYPPFVRLIQLSVRHRDIEQVNKTADALAIKLRPIFRNFLLGPEFPVVRRIQNQYHKNLLVKIKKDKASATNRNFIKQSCTEILSNPYHRSAQIVINVDPL